MRLRSLENVFDTPSPYLERLISDQDRVKELFKEFDATNNPKEKQRIIRRMLDLALEPWGTLL